MNQMTPIAAGIASLGRGNDKMLVHMTPGEVHGLQALAMAHGGSLTINPQTGLPEAGFLSSILPMVAGAALTAVSGGALTPMMSAMMVGGLGAVATGSLGKGLMMGLGAYGGAGLGESLSAAALEAPIAETVAPVIEGTGSASVDTLTMQNLQNANINDLVASAQKTGNWGSIDALAGNVSGDIGAGTGQIFSYDTQPLSVAKEQMGDLYKMAYPPKPPSFGGMGQGISNLMSPDAATRDDALKAAGGWKNLAMKGGMAAAPMLMAGLQPKPLQTPVKEPYKYYKTSYSQQRNPLWGQPGQPYFIQSYGPGSYTTDPYSAVSAKGGGLMALADGGYVPESGRYRMPGPGKEGDDSYIPATSIKNFPGAPDEDDSRFKNLSLAQLKMLAGRVKEPSVFGEVVYEIQKRKGQSAPGRRVLDTETFTAADGGPVPAPQMPISPLFQQVQTPPPDAMNNYLAQLGQRVMGGVQPQGSASLGFGFGIPRAAIDTSAPNAWGLPIPSTQQYMFNPATQTFGLNPNYVDPLKKPEPVEEEDEISRAFRNVPDSGDAAGGPIKAKYARGGLGALPEYAAGGKLLNGPGDGVSDSIPAVIKGPRPQRAALADGEFVIPARIVSELGNGSTKAGAKRLYAMMDRVQNARRKTTGKGKVAVNTKPDKLLPA